MNIEPRLREHLASLDQEPIDGVDQVLARAARIESRHRRRRRAAASVAAAAVVIVGGVLLWSAARRSPSSSVGGSTGDTVSPVTSSPSSTGAGILPPASAHSAPSTTGRAPAGTTWRAIAPDPRGPTYYPAAVWTGSKVLVVGGVDSQQRVRPGAAAYDPVEDRWAVLASPPAYNRVDPLAVWTGREMLVIGGDNPDSSLLVSSGSAYDPATDSWRTISSPPVGFVSSFSPAVWTGREVLVWPSDGGAPSMSITPIAYDPAADSWRELPSPPVARRQEAASVWTGTEWLVWGGTNDSGELADGAAFNPTTATWRVLAPSPLSGRRSAGVWTGRELVVAAGSSGGDGGWVNGIRRGHNGELALADGAAYDPASDSWRAIAGGPAHPGFVPVWTGRYMLMFAKGGVSIYDPTADSWLPEDESRNDPAGGLGTPVPADATGTVIVGSAKADRGGSVFALA